jgi:antitoxin component of MazEF toxin-antitoxin module
MQVERSLRKVGGSVMLPVPPEMLGDLGLEAGGQVRITSEGGRFSVEPAERRPDPDAAAFMARFTKGYDRALRNLSKR